MGLFDKLFKQKSITKSSNDFKALTAYQPTFTASSGLVYECELVRSAVNAIAVQTSKLKPEFVGHGALALEKRLRNPNTLQTWSQFLARVRTIVEMENTGFIVPVFDRMNRITELYPVLPSQSKLVEVNGEPWLAFMFSNGKVAQLPVWSVGMLTRMQYRNDFFGEDNRCLRSTMELIDIQDQGIREGVKSAATYRFMAQYNNVAFGDDLKAEQKRFNAQVGEDGGMALLFPANYQNIQQINSKPFVVDADTMQLIKNNVFSYFGINEDVIQNKAYGDSWAGFFEGCIEPFQIQISDVLTNLFVACGELSLDARLFFTSNRLQYISTAEKLNVSSQLADRGILNRDEVREIWNLPPLPDGAGQAYIIRGEYYNATEKVGEESDASQP